VTHHPSLPGEAPASLAAPSALALYKRVVGTVPGAGLEWTMTVPAGKWWALFAVYAVLTQGITQNPQPILFLDDGTNTFLESIGATNGQGVSTTCAYSWAPGMVLTAVAGSGAAEHSCAPIPDGLILPAGYRIRSNTLNIGANSQWNAPAAFVAELG
jgi:hypothetical protein